MSETKTSIMQKWDSLKSKYPDAIIAYRLGDFFEFFHDDAQIAAETIGITLTHRHGLPMAGVPYWAAWKYFDQLSIAGHTVVIHDDGKITKLEPVAF